MSSLPILLQKIQYSWLEKSKWRCKSWLRHRVRNFFIHFRWNLILVFNNQSKPPIISVVLAVDLAAGYSMDPDSKYSARSFYELVPVVTWLPGHCCDLDPGVTWFFGQFLIWIHDRTVTWLPGNFFGLDFFGLDPGGFFWSKSRSEIWRRLCSKFNLEVSWYIY